jgi:hypothetical protein
VVASQREESDDEVERAAGGMKLEAGGRRMAVTFTEEKVPPRRCAEIVARLEKDRPACVTLACDPGSPGKAWAAALAGRSLPFVTAFVFDTAFQTVVRQRSNAIGDLAGVLEALPGLTRAFVTGNVQLSAVKHASLRALHLLGDPLKKAAFLGLGGCSFPALETLAIELAHESAPAKHDGLVAALRGLDAPALSALEIAGVEVAPFLDALAEGPLPASWRTLRVNGSVDDDDDLLAVLRGRAGALRALHRLGLPAGDMGEETMEAARALVPAVIDADEMPELLGPAAYEAW